jgi:hypothetical protein
MNEGWKFKGNFWLLQSKAAAKGVARNAQKIDPTFVGCAKYPLGMYVQSTD